MAGFIGSKSWKKFMAKVYGFGATIVILGALFEIQHWPMASIMIGTGLTTESIIFFFSAFEPPHEEVDWSLVYPELAGMHDEEGENKKLDEEKEEQLTVTEQLDNMLEEAKIGPELIQSLGDGLRTLGDQASKLNNITDASVATNEYVTKVKSAAKNVGELSESYAKASESLTNLNVTSADGQNYGEQLQKVSKNLSALNAVYELQLQSSNEHLKADGKFYDGVSELIQNLNESINDTKKYKDEIAQLAENLGTLNTVYGNMLTAMNFSKK